MAEVGRGDILRVVRRLQSIPELRPYVEALVRRD